MDQDRTETFVWRGLLLLLVVAPLPSGSIFPFAQACLTLWTFLLLAGWSLHVDPTGWSLWAERSSARLLTIMACWVMAALVVVWQIVPLPHGIVVAISPALADLYNRTLPHGEDLAGARSLSTVPGATIQSGLLLAACGTLFWLVIELCNSRKRILALALTIIGIGTAEAFYGLARMGGSLVTPASGTFVNRNHFASLLTMALCLGVGLLLTRWEESQNADPDGAGGANIEERLDRWARISPLVTAVLTILAGIIFSFSRMGLAAPLLMLFFYGAWWMLGPVSRRTRLVGATIGAIAILLTAGAWPALEVVAERFQAIEDSYRIAAWEGTYALFQSSPVIGIGVGGLTDNLPRFLPVAIKEVFDHSHNEPVEVLAEGGLLYAGLIWFGLIVYMSTTIRVWFKRHDPVARGLGLGCLAGASAVFLQSLVEFPLRMPANAMYLSVILGLGWASIHRQAESEADTPSHSVSRRPALRLFLRSMLLVVALGGITLSSIALAADFLDRVGDGFLKRAGATSGEARQALMEEARHAYRRAIRIEFWQPAHAYKLARAHELAASLLPPLDETTQAEWSAAARFYRDAVHAHPANARLQAALGWASLQSGEIAGSRRAVQAALKLSPDDPEVRFSVSKWYLLQWAILSEDEQRAAVTLIREGAREFPERYVEATWLLTGSPEAARQILPQALPVRRLLLARLTKGGWFLDRWSEQASLPALRLPPPDSGITVLADGQLTGRQEPPAQAGTAGPWTGMVAGWLSSGLTATLDLELPPGEVMLYIPIVGEPAGGIWPTLSLTVVGRTIPLPVINSPGRHMAYVLLSSKGGTYPVQAVTTNGTILREQGRFVERRATLGPVRILAPNSFPLPSRERAG